MSSTRCGRGCCRPDFPCARSSGLPACSVSSSAVADNLTTALIMAAVVAAVGAGFPEFVAVACINIVVAANPGAAFSPFGAITTLMVWQSGKVHFWDFFHLFVPSLVNWLVPAVLMSLAVPRIKPADDRAGTRQTRRLHDHRPVFYHLGHGSDFSQLPAFPARPGRTSWSACFPRSSTTFR